MCCCYMGCRQWMLVFLKFTRFTKNQHPVTEAPKNKVVNLSDQKLEDGTLSLLQKGLSYAVAPRATPIEEILVEKAEEA